MPFGDSTPKSPKVLNLHQRYIDRIREKIIEVLSSKQRSDFAYEELYAQAMAFPLVTANDLEMLLRAFEPAIEIKLRGRSSEEAITIQE